ncbi:hypothetical protein C922_03595 [Plasmodium inui San Antonio 1]|uniref:Uncharacterized protein n=1 Tax=Plasmodium inui San Antonio 1 TaxID=1237626 RepID=W7A3A0_9APIC|nr:hypothetical protein C922_03595 [Plasmodium inui San Antonio 1]EUD66125.1 hypothetical protein C922_03595 [Plasmodium inui San Antonio 1]
MKSLIPPNNPTGKRRTINKETDLQRIPSVDDRVREIWPREQYQQTPMNTPSTSSARSRVSQGPRREDSSSRQTSHPYKQRDIV